MSFSDIPEASITQGAVLASIVAGFAFVGATSSKQPPAVLLYFFAAMALILSVWSGLLYYIVSPLTARQNVVALYFFGALGLGVLLFIGAVTQHIGEQHGERLGSLTFRFGFAIICAGFLLLAAAILR